MKRNFISLLISVCTGTKAFGEIATFSVFKSLWHLLLMSVIVSAVLVGVLTPTFKTNIKSVCNVLQREFGGIVVKENGIYPKKNPDKLHDLNYDYVDIKYYPNLPVEKDFKIKDKLNRIGFIWAPKGIAGWLKMDPDKFLVYQGLGTPTAPQWFSIVSKNEIYEYLKNTELRTFKNSFVCLGAPLEGDIPLFMVFAPLHKGEISFNDFAEDIYMYSAVMAGIKFLMMVIFNALFYSLIFALFFSLSGRRSPGNNYTFKGAFNTAVYAGLPAIVIGALFSAAKFPWLDYQSIYLLATFVYLFVIIQKRKRVV